IFAVGQSRSRRSISLALRTVALPAFQLGKQSFAMSDALDRDWRLSRNLDRIASFLFLPARREGLDVGHDICALLVGEGVPDRHVAIGEAASDRVEQILICRQRPRRSGTALESCDSEVARLGIEPNGVLAVAVPQISVTAGAISPVV